MIEFLTEWLTAIAVVLSESGPYLLVGFLVAGFLKVLVPEEQVFRHLGRDDFRSVATAALLGAPIPLCSCSVLPTAAALKRSGASKGATTSFLISTPETGVDSIGVTWALLDPLMTLLRPLAAVLTALGAGSAVNLLVRRGWDTAPSAPAGDPDHCHDHEAVAKDARLGKSRRAVAYAFGPLLDDLTPWFVLGFIVSGFIMVLVPDDFFGELVPTGWPAMLAMLVIGVPLYICATASTPVAAALIAKGLDPGSALVLLLAGPATNIATMLVVNQFLGRRVMVVYLVCIAGFALLLGGVANLLYGLLALAPETAVADPEQAFGPAATVGGLLLGALLVRSAWRIGLAGRVARRLRVWCRPLGFDPATRTVGALAASLALGLYLTSAFTVLGSGETAFVVRFGEVRRTLEQPGLYLHAPYPLERVERVPRRQVRSVDFGFQRANAPPRAAAAAWRAEIAAQQALISGDENMLGVTYSVHYDVTDPYRFRYGIEAPRTLVRALAEAAVREMVGQRASDRMLVGDRSELEAEIEAILQRELDALQAGLGVVSVNLLDIHAPREVHFAYRDVASALEDKARQIRRAEGFKKERLARARADAHRIEQEARDASTRRLAQARGKSGAFRALAQAAAQAPDLTQLRLRQESAERTLGKARLVVALDRQVAVKLMQTTAPIVIPPPPDPAPRPARTPATLIPPLQDDQ